MRTQHPHISQQYTPAYHTGVLMVNVHQHCINNDGWVVEQFSVYLQCHHEGPDWVADFLNRAEAEAFIQQAQAEITLMRGPCD